MACVAILPFELKQSAAQHLSRDGVLGASTIDLLRATGPAGWVALLAGAVLWIGRERHALACQLVLSALDVMPGRTFPLALFGTAAVLRFAWIALVPTIPTNDFLEYHELAIRLAETGRFITADGDPTAFRPPGYPALLAVFYAMLGPLLWIGKLLNVAMGAAIPVLTWRLLAEAAGERVGRLAGVLVALFPSMIGFTSLHSTEIPSTLATLAMFLLASRGLTRLQAKDEAASVDSPKRAYGFAISAGVLLAIACAIRPTIALFPAALGLVAVARVGLRHAIPFMLVFALAMAPPFVAWGMRNARELGAFVPLSTNGGVNLYFGNNAITNGTGLEMLDPKNDATSGITDEAERNARGMELGLAYWREHTGALPSLFARKIMWLVGTDGVWTRWTMISAEPRSPEGVRRVLAAVSTFAWWGLLILAMLEWMIFRVRKQSREFCEPMGEAFVLYTLVMTALLIGQERYHFPLIPAVCGGAATLIARLTAPRIE